MARYEFTDITEQEKDWLFTDSRKDAERGAIGHLRADFGHGDEFYSTWWPHQDALKKPEFVTELDMVINSLREKGQPLHNLETMRRFCYPCGAGLDNDFRSYGMKVETPDYQYMMRLTPRRGEYNLYCYCYSKEAQREYKQNHAAKKESVSGQLTERPRQLKKKASGKEEAWELE